MTLTQTKTDFLRTSQSQQRTLLRCPKRYEYHYVRRIRPQTDDNRFLFGRAVHKFLEVYYGMQIDNKYTKDEAFKHAYKAFHDYTQQHFPDSDEAHEQAELAEGVINHYIQWALDNDNFNVLGVEIPFELPLGDTVFVGHFDAIIEINGKYWIMEHKTANQMTTRHTLWDKQVTAYIMAAKEHGIPVEGVIYNTLKKAVPEKPRVLKSGKLSKSLNQNITFNSYMEAIHDLGHDPSAYQDVLDKLETRENTFFSREYVTRTETSLEEVKKDIVKTEIIKASLIELNLFPRNETRDCHWDCPFFDLCLAELEGHDTTELFQDKYKIAK